MKYRSVELVTLFAILQMFVLAFWLRAHEVGRVFRHR